MGPEDDLDRLDGRSNLSVGITDLGRVEFVCFMCYFFYSISRI